MIFTESTCKESIDLFFTTTEHTVESALEKALLKLGEYASESSIKRKLFMLDELLRIVKGLLPNDGSSASIDVLVTSLSQLYFLSVEQHKLSYRFKKVLEYVRVHYEEKIYKKLDDIISQFLASEQSSCTLKGLQAVCHLAGGDNFGLKILREHFSEYLLFVAQFLQQIVHSSTNQLILDDDQKHALCVVIKASLQLFQLFPDLIGAQLSVQSCNHNDEGKVGLKNLVQSLVKIVYGKLFPWECCSLSGTAFGLLLNTLDCPTTAVLSIGNIVQHVRGTKSNNQVMTRSSCLSLDNLTINLPVLHSDHKIMAHVVILSGILKSCSKPILMSEISPESSSSKQQIHTIAGPVVRVLDEMFSDVCFLCENVMESVMRYQAFQALTLCLNRMKECLAELVIMGVPDLWIISYDSPLTARLLRLLFSNWEDPVEGIPLLVKGIFRLLLEIHAQEETERKQRNFEFHEHLVSQLVALPCYVKGKYSFLASLIPCIGMDKLLSIYPNIKDDILHCLSANHMSSCGSSVYQVCLEQMRKEQVARLKGLPLLTEWQSKWLPMVLEALISQDRMLQINASSYIVPSTLKNVPEALEVIMKSLENIKQETLCLQALDNILHGQIVVLKAARTLNLINSADLIVNKSLLQEGLVHACDSTRAQALLLLASSLKTSEPLSDFEMKLLKDFLPVNMKCTSAGFRQQMFSVIRRILTRIRDSSTIVLRLHNKKIPHPKAITEEIPESLKEALEFVEWLMNISTQSLFPGASFQRLKTGLELFSAIIESLAVNWNPDKRKGQPPEAASMLIIYAKEQDYWNFFCPRNASVLLGCLQDNHEEIKEQAYCLLKNHFSWPLVFNELNPEDSANHLLQRALSLMSSPRVADAESGAIMCNLLYEKYILQLQWEFNTINNQPTLKQPLVEKRSSCWSLCMSFLSYLIETLNNHMILAKKDLLQASVGSPVHGVLISSEKCLKTAVNYYHKVTEKNEDFSQQLKDIIHLFLMSSDIAGRFMLQAISGENIAQNEKSAEAIISFADMDEAIDQMVLNSPTFSRTDITELNNVQNCRELIMSCAWLTIKGSCLSMADLLEYIFIKFGTKAFDLMYTDDVRLVGELFVTIFTKCRHMGVNDGCRPGFVKVCSSLLRCPDPVVNSWPRFWLDSVLSVISAKAAASSVTRRSAGLPFLVECIVSGEPASSNKVLLKYSMDSLLTLGSQPLSHDLDQTTDIPQVHALNMLKSLFQDSSLGHDVLQFVAKGTKLAIRSFSSPSWAIRNAATQLMGTLIFRILGQKKTREEESHHNTTTLEEFSTHYPSLGSFFLQQLQQQADLSTTLSLHPGIFPVLTVLAKLRSGVDELARENLQIFYELIPFLESLMASPIHSVRVLAAKALLPLTPADVYLNKTLELLHSLQDSNTYINQNELHGKLLFIQQLVAAAMESSVNKHSPTAKTHCLEHSWCELVNVLVLRFWICTTENPCWITREAYLAIVQRIVNFVLNHDIKIADNLLHLIKNLLNVTVSQTSRQPGTGRCLFIGTLVKTTLDLIPQDQVSECLKLLLQSSDYDFRLTSLTYINEKLEQEPTNSGVDKTLTSLITGLICEETTHTCMILAMKIFVKLSHKNTLDLHSKHKPLIKVFLQCIQERKFGVLGASHALPSLSIVINQFLTHESDDACNRTAQISSLLGEWMDWIECWSQPNKLEDLRIAVVDAINVTGGVLINKASKCDHTCEGFQASNDVFIQAAIRVFTCCVRLMQDEDEDIRSSAAELGSKLYQLPGSSHVSLHPSAAIERLLEKISQTFWWSGHCLAAFAGLIRGSTGVTERLSNSLPRSYVLFEQEDANMYAEPVLISKLAYTYFKIMLQRNYACEIQSSYTIEWLTTTRSRALTDLEQLVKNVESLHNQGVLCTSKIYQLVHQVVLFSHAVYLNHDATYFHGNFLTQIQNTKQIFSHYPLLKDVSDHLMFVT